MAANFPQRLQLPIQGDGEVVGLEALNLLWLRGIGGLLLPLVQAPRVSDECAGNVHPSVLLLLSRRRACFLDAKTGITECLGQAGAP